MKRLFLFLSLLWLVSSVVDAQELSFRVDACYQDQLDQAAQKEHRDDGDGKLFAIIKVTSDLDDDDLQSFRFDFNNMHHERELRDGELWLFVQYNAKYVTIRRDGYKTLKYPLPFTVKAGATYRMSLAVQAPTIIQRGLQFKVTDTAGNLITEEKPIVKVKPANSSDNFEFWGAVDNYGTIDRLMETGVYTYEISATNYKTATGRISLVNGAENFVENVRLTPNFGFLEIADEYGITGAEVYINNAKVGTVPFKSDRMECRDDYQLMISNGELYKTYNATFRITQGQTTKLSPRLASNFAETTIKVDNNAEIYLNDVRKGRGSWTGPLKAGVYNVECRLTNHVTTKKQITVKPDDASTFTIESPKPIEGSLYVSSSPSGAQIYIDGKNVGNTPSKIDHVLIGEHKVTVRLLNHKDEVRNINLREGETQTINVSLSDIASMVFRSTPSGAYLYIDGKYKGTTPYTEDMPSGNYDIKLMKKRCSTFHKKVHLDGSDPERTFKLPYKYQWKHQFYMQPMLQFGQYMGAGMAIGFYVGNFNMEADYLYGMSKEMIWWNPVPSYSLSSMSYLRPQEDKLHSMYMGGKLGYGFVVHPRWRLTPQLGAGLLKIYGDHSDCYAVTGSFGVRTDVALTRHIGLVLNPEYRFAVSKSNTYQVIADASPKFRGWGQGFNVGLGLNIYF